LSLTAADIAEILRLVEDSAFDELSLEFDGLKLNFKRGGKSDGAADRPSAAAEPTAATNAAVAAATATETTAATETESTAAARLHAAPVADPDALEIRSPMLGTFYRAPKPGAPPFVAAGSAVEPDTIVGIIEVMKLMNTVRAQVRGTVTDIVVADGALVEYGEVLLRVRKPA
jgi:acetyl-CoA carboxylase biotin carboxyl carrier protein